MDTSSRAPSQFALPRGVAGRLTGWVLAWSNAPMNRIAVETLRVAPDADVLEIGFGPGVAVKMLLDRLPRCRVRGIDPSEVMLYQAIRRNRAAAERGQVELRLGTATNLPWADGSFDAVVSLNNILVWSPIERGVAEVRRVLRPAGVFLVGMHTWAARGQLGAKAEGLQGAERAIRYALENAGFSQPIVSLRKFRIGKALFVRAVR